MSTSRKDFLQNQLKQKKQDLDIVIKAASQPQTPVDGNKLNNQAEHLLTEIEDLEKQLIQLHVSPEHFKEHWDKHIHKINHKKAKAKMCNVFNRFSGGSGAALFLIQDYHKYRGNYCVTHLKEKLNDHGTTNQFYKIVFDIPPAPGDFIKKLGGKELHDTLETNTIALIDELYKSLGRHNILFIEISLDLVKPDNDFLGWLVQDFWCKLISYSSPKVARSKVIGVVTVDENLSVDLRNNLCCNHSSIIRSDRLLPLPQEKWKEDDVYNWLCNFSLLDDNEDIKKLANWVAIENKGNKQYLRNPPDIEDRLLRRLKISVNQNHSL
jgi:inactive STAND